jgi:hypothetical protein
LRKIKTTGVSCGFCVLNVYHAGSHGDNVFLARLADTFERVYALHLENCPVYRSISTAIVITMEFNWQELT